MTRRTVMLLCLACVACNDRCGGWNSAFERMVEQPKYGSYTASDFYADKRSMRPPPDGTVPIERELGPADLTEGGPPDHPVDHFPVPLTQELLARGQDRFDIFCAPCHGVAGDGDSIVAGKMQLRRPPSLGEERLRKLSPGQLYRVVQQGYGLMPSYEHQVPVNDRWAVVAYVRALQMSQGVPIVQLPETVRAEALQSLK